MIALFWPLLRLLDARMFRFMPCKRKNPYAERLSTLRNMISTITTTQTSTEGIESRTDKICYLFVIFFNDINELRAKCRIDSAIVIYFFLSFFHHFLLLFRNNTHLYTRFSICRKLSLWKDLNGAINLMSNEGINYILPWAHFCLLISRLWKTIDSLSAK